MSRPMSRADFNRKFLGSTWGNGSTGPASEPRRTGRNLNLWTPLPTYCLGSLVLNPISRDKLLGTVGRTIDLGRRQGTFVQLRSLEGNCIDGMVIDRPGLQRRDVVEVIVTGVWRGKGEKTGKVEVDLEFVGRPAGQTGERLRRLADVPTTPEGLLKRMTEYRKITACQIPGFQGQTIVGDVLAMTYCARVAGNDRANSRINFHIPNTRHLGDKTFLAQLDTSGSVVNRGLTIRCRIIAIRMPMGVPNDGLIFDLKVVLEDGDRKDVVSTTIGTNEYGVPAETLIQRE